MKKKGYIGRLLDRYKRSKKTFILFLILHTMVILTAIRCLMTQNYESFATCILVLLLFLVPALIEVRMKHSPSSSPRRFWARWITTTRGYRDGIRYSIH